MTEVGARLVRQELWDVPVGTAVEYSGRPYKRTWWGWTNPEQGNYWPGEIGDARVTEVGNLPVSLDGFKQLTATMVRGFAAINGDGYYRSAVEGLPLLGCLDPDPGIIPGVWLHYNDTNEGIPDGTVVDTGNPDFSGRTVIKRWDPREGWLNILGADPRRGHQWVGKVLQVSGVDEVFAPEYVEGDEERIRHFKADLWRIGYQYKSNGGWCSTFEEVMRTIGITDAVAHYAPPGMAGSFVTPEQAAQLPIGSVLITGPGHQWAVFRRVDRSRNRANTERIMGDYDRHCADRMIVFSRPDNDAKAPTAAVRDGHDLRSAAAGSMIFENTTYWVTDGAGNWRNCDNTGTSPAGVYINSWRDFSTGTLRWYRFGGA